MTIKRSNSFGDSTEEAININSDTETLFNHCIEKGILSVNMDTGAVNLNIKKDELKEDFINFVINNFPELTENVKAKRIEIPEAVYDEVMDKFRKSVFEAYPWPKLVFKDVMYGIARVQRDFIQSKVGKFKKESLRSWKCISANRIIAIELRPDLEFDIYAVIRDREILGPLDSNGNSPVIKGSMKGLVLHGDGLTCNFVGLTLNHINEEVTYIKEFGIYAKHYKLGGKLPKLELYKNPAELGLTV